MRERVIRIAKWAFFPLFYVFCLVMFGYLTFPFDRLRDRIVTEFSRHGRPGQRLEIKSLSSYWFTGVEMSGVKIYLPPDEAASSPGFPRSGDDLQAASASPAKDTVINVDEAHVRVRILPLLIGRVKVDFWASAFGGEVKGSAPVGKTGGDVEVEIERVELAQIEPIAHAIGLPIKGTVNGKLALSAPDGKFNKATGNLDVTISGVTVGDGKTKIQNLIELPAAKLGDITLAAEAKEGALKVTKLEAKGTDLELIGDGKVSVRDPWGESNADIYLRFKFTDAYRNKNATTKSLLGEPGSSMPGLMELQVPKMKRARRPDGFYGWHVHGALKRLKFDPTTSDAPTAGAGSGRGRSRNNATDPAGNAAVRRGGVAFPLGTSQAVGPRDKDRDSDDAPSPRAPEPSPRAPEPSPRVHEAAPTDNRRGGAAPAPEPPPPPPPAPEPAAPEPPPAAPEQGAAPQEQQPVPEAPPQ